MKYTFALTQEAQLLMQKFAILVADGHFLSDGDGRHAHAIKVCQAVWQTDIPFEAQHHPFDVRLIRTACSDLAPTHSFQQPFG